MEPPNQFFKACIRLAQKVHNQRKQRKGQHQAQHCQPKIPPSFLARFSILGFQEPCESGNGIRYPAKEIAENVKQLMELEAAIANLEGLQILAGLDISDNSKAEEK